MPTWNSKGWKFLSSLAQTGPDRRLKVIDTLGRSFDPPLYENGNGMELMDRQQVTYFLPADWQSRDKAAPGGSLYFSHTHWLAIRQIHLSGLEPTTFEGRELPTISESEANR